MKHQVKPAKNILIVDDSEVDQKIIRWWCQNWGYAVDHAGTAAESLQKIRNQQFDLIITDIMLPDMSGFDLYHKIKSMPASPGVIFNSAISRNHPRLREFENYVLIEKPCEPQAFKTTVEKYLQENLYRIGA